MSRRAELVRRLDSRVGDALLIMDDKIDYRAVKVTMWGVATASMFGAAAAALGAVAAGAGAYVAVRTAVRVTRESREHREHQGPIELS